MNINKLFPRLTIRSKLRIAFGFLALAPLGLAAIVVTRATIVRLQATARRTLGHDIETARTSAEEALALVERDVAFLKDALRGAGIGGPPESQMRHTVETFVARHDALFQIKVIDRDGMIGYRVVGGGKNPVPVAPETESGTYYAIRAAAAEGAHLLIPVELLATGADGTTRPLPSVAVLVPVLDSTGGFQGVVVGEAYAAVLFQNLDAHSPEFAGVTVLTDVEELVLYHSEWKRDWARLLAPPLESVWSGTDPTTTGSRVTDDGYLVASTQLRLGTSGPPLTMHRVVQLSLVNAPVHEFLLGIVIGGGAIVLLVVLFATVAARQFTEPIYALRRAAGQLARGRPDGGLQIATNDELEDLAVDFQTMADTLTAHRRHLEELVTERTRELQETHAELAYILDHSADAIVGTDNEGRIRVWNRGAASLFGYSADEVVGRDADMLLPPSDSSRWAERAYLERELDQRGAVVNLPTRRVAKDGRPIPVSVTHTRLRGDDGTVHGSSLIIRDTSLQATVEEHMRRSERLAAVSVMAAGLAHELNNPLAIIANRLECMESDIEALADASTLKDDLAVLKEHVSRLGGVTGDLLQFAREGDDQLGPVDLGATVHRIAGMLERTLIGRNVSLAVIDADHLPRVFASERALETVCMNLLLNAADAMPSGGTITITTGAGLEDVELRVRDEGSGVPPDLRNRIFEPFFTTKDAQHGTGLGLSLCRSIIERFGGHIWVEAGASDGAEFAVRLRSAPQEAK